VLSRNFSLHIQGDIKVNDLDQPAGNIQNGLPYNRFGDGPDNLVICQGEAIREWCTWLPSGMMAP
jgi:hypothetical protein